MTKPDRMTDARIGEILGVVGGVLNLCSSAAKVKLLDELEDELRRARSGEEQAGRERWMANKELEAARMLARDVAHELGEARAWAAKVEAASGDAHRELSAILFNGPDEKLDDAARRVVAECGALRAERDGYREAAKRLAECLGGYAHESADNKEILGILALRADAASCGELPELFGRLESELREAQEHAKECGPLRAEVGRLRAEVRQRDQLVAEAVQDEQSAFAERNAAREDEEAARAEVERLKAMLDETRCQRDGALEHVAKLEARIDRMRQRIQELEEHHG